MIAADGAQADAACAAAIACAAGVLDELCAELTLLRSADRDIAAAGPVARRMQRAVWAMPGFITPMAAVAGAVAEHVLAAMVEIAPLDRAYVNNGGDIALHLSADHRLRVGLARPGHDGMHGAATVHARDPIRGVATSGWPGRSYSLGIADAVTVLAATASMADAAATVIANAVDLPGHPAVTRLPARMLAPDSDLGDRQVTRHVGCLTPAEVERALASGMEAANALHRSGLIVAAALHLQGRTCHCAGAPGTAAVT